MNHIICLEMLFLGMYMMVRSKTLVLQMQKSGLTLRMIVQPVKAF